MTNFYTNPLEDRYPSAQMKEIFLPRTRIVLWRKLWVALAKAQQKLGLSITDGQIKQMEENVQNIDFAAAAAFEERVKHDVMAHVHTFAAAAPLAEPIIHLGATSCFVTDNSDLIIYKTALELILKKITLCIKHLRDFSVKHKSVPTLGFTHFQPAQLTTVGKRTTLWIQDLLMDFNQIKGILDDFKLRGAKGATGTCASFLSLFDGDVKKVKSLENLVLKHMGFGQNFIDIPNKTFAVCGQTYPRKFDFLLLSALSSVAQSAHKAAEDLRLLMHLGEIEEPIAAAQIGSSAMPYKRNPVKSERICSIARFVMNLPTNAAQTASTQWFERTLDDSANRRIVMPQAFLGLDAVLNLYITIAKGLVVNKKIIEKNVLSKLPYMATENIIMECVKRGGDRQQLHEAIRVHSFECVRAEKDGGQGDLIKKIKSDKLFALVKGDLDKIICPSNYIGMADIQVDDFINFFIDPILKDFCFDQLQTDIKI